MSLDRPLIVLSGAFLQCFLAAAQHPPAEIQAKIVTLFQSARQPSGGALLTKRPVFTIRFSHSTRSRKCGQTWAWFFLNSTGTAKIRQ
jgi:hypothetical protein